MKKDKKYYNQLDMIAKAFYNLSVREGPIEDYHAEGCPIGDKKSAITESARQIIIEYLTDHVSASCAEIAAVLNLQSSRTRDYLSALVSEGIIVAEGANRNRTYRLKK